MAGAIERDGSETEDEPEPIGLKAIFVGRVLKFDDDKILAKTRGGARGCKTPITHCLYFESDKYTRKVYVVQARQENELVIKCSGPEHEPIKISHCEIERRLASGQLVIARSLKFARVYADDSSALVTPEVVVNKYHPDFICRVVRANGESVKFGAARSEPTFLGLKAVVDDDPSRWSKPPKLSCAPDTTKVYFRKDKYCKPYSVVEATEEKVTLKRGITRKFYTYERSSRTRPGLFEMRDKKSIFVATSLHFEARYDDGSGIICRTRLRSEDLQARYTRRYLERVLTRNESGDYAIVPVGDGDVVSALDPEIIMYLRAKIVDPVCANDILHSTSKVSTAHKIFSRHHLSSYCNPKTIVSVYQEQQLSARRHYDNYFLTAKSSTGNITQIAFAKLASLVRSKSIVIAKDIVFEAAYGDPCGRGSRRNVVVSPSVVFAEFLNRRFIHDVVVNGERYLKVRPGSVDETLLVRANPVLDRVNPPALTRGWQSLPVRYVQANPRDEFCAMYSLASALYLCGAVDKSGTDISEWPLRYAKHPDPLDAAKNFFNSLEVEGWEAKEYNQGKQEPMEQSNYITVIQIKSARSGSIGDGRSNDKHCVALVRDHIVDPNRRFTVEYTKAGLDTVCLADDKFVSYAAAVRFMPRKKARRTSKDRYGVQFGIQHNGERRRCKRQRVA